jgi:hypothetical protein
MEVAIQAGRQKMDAGFERGDREMARAPDQ